MERSEGVRLSLPNPEQSAPTLDQSATVVDFTAPTDEPVDSGQADENGRLTGPQVTKSRISRPGHLT